MKWRKKKENSYVDMKDNDALLNFVLRQELCFYYENDIRNFTKAEINTKVKKI